MESNEQATDTGLPDLAEKIDSVVGHLTVVGHNLRTTNPLRLIDANKVDEAMLFIAGLQQVVTWEPAPSNASRENGKAAEQLRQFAAIGPRPPAVVEMLMRAAVLLENPPMVYHPVEVNQSIILARQELAESAERLLVAHRRLGSAP